MRRRSPHWIQHTHLFDDDEYECSVCRAAADRPYLFCPRCGAKLGAAAPRPAARPVSAGTVTSDDEAAAKRVRDHVKTCAILWIVVGCFQVLSCVCLISGVWNIFWGIKELGYAKTIQAGDPAVYRTWDGALTSIIIGAVVNFLFGLVIGCILSVYDFIIRDMVMKNKKAFHA